MNLQEHIKNKISEPSDDEKLAVNIMRTVGMLDELKLDYAILGSCGIQSYFDYFLRLPNDLDILIHYENLFKIKNYCQEHNHEFVEQLGRTKISINELSIHIIPDKLNSIDKVTNKIFTRIDLSRFIKHSPKRKVKLLNSSFCPEVHVFSLEVNLLVELVRPIYTGSLMNIFYVMRYLEIDFYLFKTLYSENVDLKEIIVFRLEEYPSKIEKMSYLSNSDIKLAIEKITSLRNSLTKTL